MPQKGVLSTTLLSLVVRQFPAAPLGNGVKPTLQALDPYSVHVGTEANQATGPSEYPSFDQ